MRALIAVPFWGKNAEMVKWTLEGIAQNFNPANTQVVYYFDGLHRCDVEPFEQLAPGILADFKWDYFGDKTEVLECGSHRQLIDYFMNRTDADFMIVPQDDNRFQSPTTYGDFVRVIENFGDRCGYIGSRDGYGLRYGGIVSSPFSGSNTNPQKLPPGTYHPCLMVNPGPLTYTRSLVNKIGTIDPAYGAWYWWDDYSLRAHAAGLSNVLLSIDALHMKFGEIMRSVVYDDPQGHVARDLALLNRRWASAHGGNVI